MNKIAVKLEVVDGYIKCGVQFDQGMYEADPCEILLGLIDDFATIADTTFSPLTVLEFSHNVLIRIRDETVTWIMPKEAGGSKLVFSRTDYAGICNTIYTFMCNNPEAVIYQSTASSLIEWYRVEFPRCVRFAETGKWNGVHSRF